MVKRPSDLFNEPSPQPSPPVQPVRTSESRAPGMVLVAVLAAVLVMLTLQRCDVPWGDWGKRQDEQDDKRHAVVKPGVLYIVRERQFPAIAENESVAMIAELCSKNAGTEFRDLDDDEDSSKRFVDHAKSKGIDPPCVVFRPKDGELSGVIKLPAAGKESDLMEVFK